MSRAFPHAACLALMLLAGAGAWAGELDRPEILHVAVLGRLVVGRVSEARVTYRARRANVVAVVQAIEDLEGARRATRQRELSVVAAAFGQEAGELAVPLVVFETPGRKRVVLTLVTDEREESDPASIEIEVAP